ncbi:MAG: hypothetical protein AB7Y46_08405 [Armatimonadota bacterium]
MNAAAAILLALTLTAAAALAQENLVASPSFEEGVGEDGAPVGWTLRVPEGVEVRADGGHSGERYVHIVDQAADAGQFVESARVPCRPGGQYTATAWFRTADACQPGIYINIYDAQGARIHHVYERASGPTDGWVQVTVSTEAPMHAWEVSAAVYGYVGDVGDFDADDVQMTVTGGDEPGSLGIDRAQPGDREPVEIAGRLELFVDDYLVDALTGEAERRLHHPVPREVVLTLDQPWEGQTSAYFVVFPDGERIRMYYRGEFGGEQACCLAESADGVHFERVMTGLFDFQGQPTNVVWTGRGAHNFTPFLDPNPAAPADQRYKAVGYSHAGKGLGVFASPDGIHWRELLDHPAITDGAFDSQNLAFWDPLRALYVDFHRKGRGGVRDIMTCTSPDFVSWSEPVFIEYADVRREHMYTNGIMPYFRAPHIYLGLPARFVPARTKIEGRKEPGVSDAVLMSSRDGRHFQRWEEGFIRPGLDPQVWTDRNNYPAWGMIETAPGEISLYWTEHYRHPTMRLRRGTIRTDGFVSVHAGGEAGEMLTRPLVFSGERLVVNYATSAVGWLRFELCDEAGEPIEGFSLVDSEVLFGNELAHEVTWRGSTDVSALAGRPVRLRVQLQDADLYSIRFAAAEQG